MWLLSLASTNSTLIASDSPCWRTFPMSTARTPKSEAARLGSASLTRLADWRDATLRFGNWDRVFVRLSVMPSLRYSVFGSAATLAKGNTASESIV